MSDLASAWKKTDKRALRLTWKGWSLYDDAKEKDGVAAALNDALQDAALVLWKKLVETGPLRGEKLANAIDDVLMAKWTGTAHRYRLAGAEDTEVMDRAGAALRKFLRANPIDPSATEAVGMRGLLRRLEEGDDRGRILDGLTDRMDRGMDANEVDILRLTPEERAVVAKLPERGQFDLWPYSKGKALPKLTDKFDPEAGKVPQWFILHLDRHTLLVDTEGYDYCRYAGRLVGSWK